MNFLRKHIRLITLLAPTLLVGVAAGFYFDMPAPRGKIPVYTLRSTPPPTAAKASYACPMHPEVVSDHADNCSKCGMALVPAGEAAAATGHSCETHSEKSCEAHAEKASGCCAKDGAQAMQLPPGHPPVPGMTVGTNASCPMH